ncbi:HAD family hydrolase [Antribacter gilvus]|uniref:HAD family hydrolase n=1 Tax=Antribacter gilvus TaxID=2304675 RepID=UPI000F7B6CAA|nr:HAD hydrolase family protein [Antribacter gilvus]
MDTYATQRLAAKLVALDIDGTIIGRDGIVPQVTRLAIERVRAEGIEVVLATGRSLVGVLPIAQQLGLTRGWFVASNGAITGRFTGHWWKPYKVVSTRVFDPQGAFSYAMCAIPDAFMAVEEIGRGFRVNVRFGPGLLNGKQRIVSERDLWSRPVTRAVIHAEGAAGMAAQLHSAGVTAVPAGPDWIDVTKQGLSKAVELDEIRRHLGIARDETVAVGDGLNDLEMLKWSGYGVAMGHAPEEVLMTADHVTGTIGEHGAAHVLESLCQRPSMPPRDVSSVSGRRPGV